MIIKQSMKIIKELNLNYTKIEYINVSGEVYMENPRLIGEKLNLPLLLLKISNLLLSKLILKKTNFALLLTMNESL